MHKRRGFLALKTSSVIGEKEKFINRNAIGLLNLTKNGFLFYYFYFVSHV